MVGKHERQQRGKNPQSTVDREVPPEFLNNTDSPTSLDLFRFSPNELPLLRVKRDAAESFRVAFSEINTFYGQVYVSALNNRVEQIGDAKKMFAEQDRPLKYHMTTNRAYVQMFDELSADAPPGEIISFFRACLDINDRLTPDIIIQVKNQRSISGRPKFSGIPPLLLGRTARKSGVDQRFNKLSGQIPAWFPGTNKEWVLFAAFHSVFPAFLDQNNYQLGITSPNYRPDWLQNTQNPLPDVRIVEDEQQACIWQYMWHRRQRALADEELDKMSSSDAQLYAGAVAAVEQERRQVIPLQESFADAVLFLHSTDGVAAYRPNPKALATMDQKQLENSVIRPDKSKENTIRNFTSSEAAFCVEHVALFLEKTLQTGGIIQTAKDTVTANHVGMFAMLFDVLSVNVAGADDAFQLLSEYDNKAFNILNGHIRILLSTLPSYKISDLAQLIKDQQNHEFEPIIWAMAQRIAESVKGKTTFLEGRQTKTTAEAIRSFASRWLSTNSAWAAEEINKKLGKPSISSIESISTQLNAIKEEFDRLQKGNLGDWETTYVIVSEEGEDIYISIERATLEEKCQSLAKCFMENNISADAQKVMLALDWAVLIPELYQVQEENEESDLRPQNISWIKVDDARIVYSINKEAKQVNFTFTGPSFS